MPTHSLAVVYTEAGNGDIDGRLGEISWWELSLTPVQLQVHAFVVHSTCRTILFLVSIRYAKPFIWPHFAKVGGGGHDPHRKHDAATNFPSDGLV
jgi:hypothetical protein